MALNLFLHKSLLMRTATVLVFVTLVDLCSASLRRLLVTIGEDITPSRAWLLSLTFRLLAYGESRDVDVTPGSPMQVRMVVSVLVSPCAAWSRCSAQQQA
jgi:hypothetical protein